MGKLNFEVGNIIELSKGMDAIVNSQNKYMIAGSGVCGAIYKAASPTKLLEYCRSNFDSNMNVNEVRMTPGFNLGVDIIHIYVPKAYESSDPIQELIESYKKIIEFSLLNNYKKIVTVSLGTGVHGYSNEVVAPHIVNYLKNELANVDLDITMVLNTKNKYDLYLKFPLIKRGGKTWQISL